MNRRNTGICELAPTARIFLPKLAAAIFTLALSVSGAWAQDNANWTKVLAAAKSEGKVVFYSAQTPPIIDRIVNGFKKAHPDIAVETLRAVSADVTTKIEQERATGIDGADVLITSDNGWLISLAKAGVLMKPTGPALAAWPAKYIVEGSMVIPGTEPFVISYNTSLVVNPPKGYADLLKPEYKDKIGSSDLTATTLVAFYDWLEKTQGPDYLVKLKAQNPKLYNGANNLAQSIASGEVAIGAFGLPGSAIPLMQKGAPLNYVTPNPDLGFEYGLAAVNWSKRKNAALVFEDYVMSADGQAAWHSNNGTASPLGVPNSPSISTITAWDAAAYTPEVIKAYTEHWNKIFK